ncbi:DUF4258 domain-containing protein [Sulfurospirillum deleyianum]|uniref:Toxin n=1 Tax=Sulfurospirillum deleyianum (strain ATCC 51133 / DSM 6946 / 5175) TaxID=525898 RepID=D1AZW6_SULD5|nr:DUF4258 domain-containing protein [Sulfurospirillum deleyianum]ACZ11583.1 conserved hypothetical protein [Sulfurospirillum deleyianum DSM 6946]
MDKIIRWDEAKNQLLQLQRVVSFEEVLNHIEQGTVLNRLMHPNREKYPHQEIFVVEMKGYIWYVPFVENESEIFLKTIIPSRKLLKSFGGKKQ